MKAGKVQNSTGPFRTAALAAAIAVLLIICLAVCLVKLSTGMSASADNPNSAHVVASTASSLPVITETPAPTQAPVPSAAFIPDAAAPAPAFLEQCALGEKRPLTGSVSCNYPLDRVTATFLCDYSEDPFYPYTASVTFAAGSARTSYDFTDADTVEEYSLAALLDYGNLHAGVNRLIVTVHCAGEIAPIEVLSTQFYVLGDTWKRYAAGNFSNGSYATAHAFFQGDDSRFLYRYQNVFGRYTVADPAWEKQYITAFDMGYDEPWLIHIDAVPNYTLVRKYLYSTHVRVHGTNGDTGARQLSELVVVYHGSYVSRFTSAKRRTVSHHALGTATDINAVMEPNMNTPENRALLDNEVGKCLAYNGIRTENGVQYYDFTYTGSAACTDFGVPQTVINYLLYELAFYRAGFEWGHYYNSTSDGMHFTLTDNIKKKHDGANGLQKVTEYYN